MTIKEAFKDLISSKSFKEIAKKKDKKGGKYRVFLSRYKKNLLKTGAMVDMLIDNGYKIDIHRN